VKVLAIYLAIVGALVGALAFFQPWQAVSLSSDTHNVNVAGVTDGDTLTLSGSASSRLIGVDTPEVPPGPSECFGPQASKWLKRTLPVGTKVRIEDGAEKRDKYGRSLVYLWTRPRKGRAVFINAQLLRRGYARRLEIKPNDKYGRALDRAQRYAKKRKRGLWGACS